MRPMSRLGPDFIRRVARFRSEGIATCSESGTQVAGWIHPDTLGTAIAQEVRRLCPLPDEPMNIRFVSPLTPEDEIRLAEGLLTAFASLLDPFPIAYSLKIEAGHSYVFQR